MIRHWCAALVAGIGLAGCAAPQAPLEPMTPQQQAERHRQLQQIDSWRVKGRVAIVNGDEAWHLNVEWQQHNGDYLIDLWGPFGSGRVQLAGDAYGVRLIDSDQAIYYASDPDSLLYEHTGVRMPVSGLRYWIRGLVDPQYKASRLKHDAAGRLTAAQQNDWQITFTRYGQVNGLALPEKLSVERRDLRVKLVVDNWHLVPSAS